MNVFFSRFQWLAVVFLGLTLAGCAGHSAPTQFYMLEPVTLASTSPTPVTGKPAVRIGFDPVEVPEYLNRPQIVTHVDRSEFQLNEFNQWAEPLSDTLTRVIAENLSEMLQVEGFDILSMSRPVETDYTVSVQILRMDGKLGQGMVLVARWFLFKRSDNSLLRTTRSVFQEPVGDDTYQGLLQVQNQMLESLSREMAEGIKSIVTQSSGS